MKILIKGANVLRPDYSTDIADTGQLSQASLTASSIVLIPSVIIL